MSGIPRQRKCDNWQKSNFFIPAKTNFPHSFTQHGTALLTSFNAKRVAVFAWRRHFMMIADTESGADFVNQWAPLVLGACLASVCLEIAATQHSNIQIQYKPIVCCQLSILRNPGWHHFATDSKLDWGCTEEWISSCNSGSNFQRNRGSLAMEGTKSCSDDSFFSCLFHPGEKCNFLSKLICV